MSEGRGTPRLAVTVAVATMAALVASASASAKPPTIFVNGDSPANYKFSPRVLEIDRGQTANWSWDSNGPHDVTFPKLDKSSITGASETYKLKFKKRGTFRYLCSVHGFRGKIIAG